MEETDDKNKNKIEEWLNKLQTLTSQDELIVTCKVILILFSDFCNKIAIMPVKCRLFICNGVVILQKSLKPFDFYMI